MPGIFGKIKDFYLKLEDSYYSVLDKIDAKVPIYGVIDRVDRVVPSLLLLILVAVLAVAGIALALVGGVGAAPVVLTVAVLDEQGSPVEGATVVGTFFGGTVQFNTDANGEVRINIPLGTVVDLRITKSEFEDKTSRVTVSKAGQEESITLRSLVPLPTEKTLQFVDGAGRKLAGTRVSVSFSCSKPGVTPLEPVIVDTGELKATPPKGCGVFTVSATASGYKSAAYSVEKSMQIMLEALASGQGSLKITVSDADTGAAVDGMKVALHNEAGIVDTRYTDFGEVLFSNIIPGTYYVTVEDEAGDYGSETITAIAVAQGTITKREVEIGKSVKARLSVSAKDKASKAAITGAEITLHSEDGLVVSKMKTNASGIAEFPVKNAAKYYVRGFHEEYLVSELVSVDLSTATGGVQKSAALEMEKLTADNSGRVEAKVADEDNKAVENATVSLFDAETDFLAGYPSQTTDANGIAKFKGVASGRYYALAYKYPASGKSSAGTVDVRATNLFAITMVIGEATVRIEAVDLGYDPVPFAQAEIRAENGDELGTMQLDESGAGTISVKADKRIFAIVKAEGYASYHSDAIQLFKDQEVAIVAALEEEILGTEPSVELKGVYEPLSGSAVEVLTGGGKYTARFRVKVPSGASYSQLGLHVRTGADDSEMVEKDPLYIDSVSAPNTSVIKGKTYKPPFGPDSPTNEGSTKWADIAWAEGSIESGTYDVSVNIRVRREVAPGTELQLHYRAWAVAAGSRYLRDPDDSLLGEAADASARKSLYAATYDKYFYEGAQSLCEDYFCYSERVYDRAEGLYINEEPYIVKIFGEYDFNFSVTNNSDEDIYTNSTLKVKNTDDGTTTDKSIRIKYYMITNAESVQIRSMQPDSNTRFEIPAIDGGDFGPHKTIDADLLLQPAMVGNSEMQAKIISGGSEAFIHETRFNSVKQGNLLVEVQPAVIAAYAEADLNVHVTYSEDKTSVKDARVRVTRTESNNSSPPVEALTDAGGVAYFAIPASSPGTIIKIEVEKTDYAPAEVEKIVTCAVVEFETEDGGIVDEEHHLKASLNLLDKKEDIIELTARSIVSQEIKIGGMKIEDAEPAGNFQYLLNTEVMNNFLNNQLAPNGVSFGRIGEEHKISIKAALVQGAMLDEETDLEGLVIIALDNSGGGADTLTNACEYPLPVDIEIDLAPGAEDEECLTITNSEWDDYVISGGVRYFQFTVKNNCMTEASAEPNLKLENLRAVLSWSSNAYGSVGLTLSGNSGSYYLLLDEGTPEQFPLTLAPEDELTGRLEFTPNAMQDIPDAPAVFSVSLEADVAMSGGAEVRGNKIIDAELSFVNPAECIEITTEESGDSEESDDTEENGDNGIACSSESSGSGNMPKIFLAPGEDSQEFTINTEECGDIKMDIALCRYDTGKCSGGIEGEIDLSDWLFEDVEEGSVDATAKRGDIPGYYDMQVEARVEGTYSWQHVGYVPVIVMSDGEKHVAAGTTNYFSMVSPCSYKITFPSANAEEKSTLRNNYLVENVQVSARECDWAESAGRYNYKDPTHDLITDTGLSGATGPALTGRMGFFPGIVAVIQIVVDIVMAILTVASIFVCGPCAFVVGGIGAGIHIGLNEAICYISSTTCCTGDDRGDLKTLTLPDYITNLKKDFQSIDLALPSQYSGYITATADTSLFFASERDAGMPYNEEKPGHGVWPLGEEMLVKFNNNGVSEAKPIYGLLTVKFKENMQGDKQHIDPSVKCDDEDGHFGPWHIASGGDCHSTSAARGSVTSIDATAKMHMRFDTAPIEQPLLVGEDADCIMGTLTGATGPDATPKVKYAWTWGGVGMDMCDSSNPDAVYCDATQFTIMVNKRLYALYDFLAANDFEFDCPPDTRASGVSQYNADNSTHAVASGEVGVEAIGVALAQTNATANVDVRNRTSSNQNGTVTVRLWKYGQSSTILQECKKDVVNLDETTSITCNFTGLDGGDVYGATATIACETGRSYLTCIDADVDTDDSVSAEFIVPSDTCTQTRTGGTDSGIAYWAVSDPTTVWTTAVPNSEALQNLTHFTAYLMKDGYGADFTSDFINYYNNINTFDTPSYFNSLGVDPTGQRYGFDRLMETDQFFMLRKWYANDDPQGRIIPAPGLYNVALESAWGDDWKFFDDSGNPTIAATVIVEYLIEPATPSPFYSMPLDGYVGVENNTIKRVGYGTSFVNAQPDELVQFDNSATPFKTYPDAGSTPVVKVSSDIEKDFAKINTNIDTKGVLLGVSYGGTDTGEIVFAPHYATPVLMKASRQSTSNSPFGVFYATTQNETPMSTGSYLAQWTGMPQGGTCLDFSGMYVWEAFNERRDRLAAQQDLTNWVGAYGIDWGSVGNAGDVYLRTMFYTPAGKNSALQARQPLDSIVFITPDSASGSVALNGVSGMQSNNSIEHINSVGDVFQLVRDGKVCVNRTSTTATFWWNPKAVRDAQGTGSPYVANSYTGSCAGKRRNINCETSSLQAGVNCIGG